MLLRAMCFCRYPGGTLECSENILNVGFAILPSKISLDGYLLGNNWGIILGATFTENSKV